MEKLIKELNDFNKLCEYFYMIEYYNRMASGKELDDEFSKLDEKNHYLEKIDNIYKNIGLMI